jgi:hypothetical protein
LGNVLYQKVQKETKKYNKKKFMHEESREQKIKINTT